MSVSGIISDDEVPTPGSDLAVIMGCTCPVMDNARGEGRVHHFDRLFIITLGCPLHSEAPPPIPNPQARGGL